MRCPRVCGSSLVSREQQAEEEQGEKTKKRKKRGKKEEEEEVEEFLQIARSNGVLDSRLAGGPK